MSSNTRSKATAEDHERVDSASISERAGFACRQTSEGALTMEVSHDTVGLCFPAVTHTVDSDTDIADGEENGGPQAGGSEVSRSDTDVSREECYPLLKVQGRPMKKRKAFVQVLDCGVTAEQGTRRTMEDQHTIVSDGVPFFGVYDGHGGMQCAEYLRDRLHLMILGHPDIKTDPEKAIRESIVEADRAFLQLSEAETNESGSVCAVVLLLEDVLVVGNVGDCEAVLSRNGRPIVLTVKHNLQNNPAEVERVRAVGGKIFHNRVGHPKFNPTVVSLAVTRAIGDAGFKLDKYTDGKPSGVIADPDTSSTKLTSEDEFFVIGCDGLWDVMSYGEVVDFCHRRFASSEDAQAVAEELAQAALNRGSTDNVTAMLVRLTRRDSTANHSVEFIPEAAVSGSVARCA